MFHNVDKLSTGMILSWVGIDFYFPISKRDCVNGLDLGSGFDILYLYCVESMIPDTFGASRSLAISHFIFSFCLHLVYGDSQKNMRFA